MIATPADLDSDDAVLDRTTFLFAGLVDALDEDRNARQLLIGKLVELLAEAQEQGARQAAVQAEAVRIVRRAGKIASVSERTMTRRPVLPVLVAGLVGAGLAILAVGGGFVIGRFL